MHWFQSSLASSRACRSVAFLTFALSLSACNNSAGPPAPQGISVVSGDNQFAVVGSAPANPLVALVVDDNGSPFAGATVTWIVTGGGGTVSDSTSTSDATGHASIRYTAGAFPGVATVVAIVSQVWTASFTVHIEASSNGTRVP